MGWKWVDLLSVAFSSVTVHLEELSRRKLVLLAGDRVDAENRETKEQAEGQPSLREYLKCLEEEECQARV